MSTTATLDPTETIAAAVRELYDQLRDLVDRGPTDDPSLLDEIGVLTRRIRSRITRARKRAEVVDSDATEKPAPRVVEPQPTSAAPAGQTKSTVAVAATGGTATAHADRVSVRPAKVPLRFAPAPGTGRHRAPEHTTPQRARRQQLLVVALILLTSGAIALTSNPLIILGGTAVAVLVRAGVLRLIRTGGHASHHLHRQRGRRQGFTVVPELR